VSPHTPPCLAFTFQWNEIPSSQTCFAFALLAVSIAVYFTLLHDTHRTQCSPSITLPCFLCRGEDPRTALNDDARSAYGKQHEVDRSPQDNWRARSCARSIHRLFPQGDLILGTYGSGHSKRQHCRLLSVEHITKRASDPAAAGVIPVFFPVLLKNSLSTNRKKLGSCPAMSTGLHDAGSLEAL